ncbi:hypothetical protein BC827DRAFT_1156239 [Russula dissimulans]|nr:hypothetical protein BC827DRAFT_1156239 [Russula dissimulans]
MVNDKFFLDPREVRQATLDARASLQPDNAFIYFVRELQAAAQGALLIFAMSNISAPDYVVTRGKPADWSILECVFTSADAGMRKPDLCFFKFVLEEIKAEPSSVVFVDDSIENVLPARSLGVNGIVFDDVKRVRQALRYFVSEPVSRGQAFLEERAGRLESENNLGEGVSENFAQLLILEATGNRETSVLPDRFPEDLDTTSIGLTVTQPDDHVVNSVLNEILHFVREDGITMTYFDPERLRTDPVVALNILSLFYSRGRGHEVAHTLDWVLCVLGHRAYLDGTRYYETGECFPFFASRLLRSGRNDPPLLRPRVLEWAGCSGDALALAMRVIAGAEEDGGWEAGWVYKYGTSGVKIGNRGLTTALALNAIASLYPQQVRERSRGAAVVVAAAADSDSDSELQAKAQMTTTALSELVATALPSPLLSLPPQQTRREQDLPVGVTATDVYTYPFSTNGPPSLQTIVV